MKQGARDFLICISLANLALLGFWPRLLDGNTSYLATPQPSHFLALIFGSSLLAVVFWCGILLARRSGGVGRFLARWIFLQIIVICISLWCTRSLPAVLLATVVLILPVVVGLYPSVPRWFATLLVVLSPCVAFLGARATWEMCHLSRPEVIRGSLDPLSTQGPRVLLVVFDEMGENVAFKHRPAGVEMPAFDRLRREAVVATGAYPPGNFTLTSMPALLTGRAVKEVVPVSRNEASVRYLQNQHFESLSLTTTVFSDVRAMGLGTAMIGWYHPYCSTLHDLDYCVHIKADMAIGLYNRGGLLTKVLDEASQALPIFVMTNWARQRRVEAARETHEHENNFLFRLTKDALTEFHSGLMIVHLPIPHPPVLEGTGIYFANLAAADNALREMRSIMERVGTWDDTTVVVTSDHWWRTHLWKSEWRNLEWKAEETSYMDADKEQGVPFIVKLPRQHSQETYIREFNLLVVRKLIPELLTEKVRTSEELKAWLDLHHKDAPVQAYLYTLSP